MSLITFQNVHYGVGGPALLDDVVLGIETGERICVVGRNGAGKSTLLRLLAREIVPDEGEIRIQEGVRVGRLAQEVPQDTDGDVFDVVADGLGELGHWLAEFHHISHAAEVDMDALSEVQSKIERANGWDLERRVTEVITKLDLPEDAAFASLSGGMKRRVLLAQALVAEPDVLLLDEPTNHLDIASIDWLEEFLRGFRGSIVFVTHDRRFLRALATRIVEIDRGQVTSWPGDYDNYLRRREERLHAEAQERARFDKFLAQEEVWIRQGIKARRTRDEGRVRRLEAMRVERAERRNQAGNVKLATTTAATSGKKVIQAENVSFAFPAVNGTSRVLVRDFDTTILRGDRIGLIGPNGVGKTTLIQLLLGQLAPQTGEVRIGTNLQVAYFDQHRTALREDWNALDNVSEGLEFIETNGGRKHVLAYLQDFLFTPERARAPITRLSGGERNRLLLAKLFAQPSNLLVMDEPTNDLDVETLELLEELLADYPGTLLLVSHDRDFLDHVVTSTLVFEGDGRIGDYVGGYSDWLRQRAKPTVSAPAKPQLTAQVPVTAKVEAPTARRKLGFKEQHELTQLPARIETLETDIAARTAAMQKPEFYRKNAAEILAANAELAARQSELEAAYARWEQLEAE